MKLLLACLLILYSGILNAFQIEGGLRLQLNSYRYLSEPGTGLRNSSTAFSPGFNLQLKTSSTSFLRAGLMLQKRNYKLNYTQGMATFTNSNLNLTELELSFGKYLFSRGRDVGFYVNGGIQTLFRNWGEEVYREDIIPKTYWANIRLSSMMGAGYSVMTDGGMKISFGAGRNDFLGSMMATDLRAHQYFFYIQFNGIKKIKSVNSIHKKCNNQF